MTTVLKVFVSDGTTRGSGENWVKYWTPQAEGGLLSLPKLTHKWVTSFFAIRSWRQDDVPFLLFALEGDCRPAQDVPRCVSFPSWFGFKLLNPPGG